MEQFIRVFLLWILLVAAFIALIFALYKLYLWLADLGVGGLKWSWESFKHIFRAATTDKSPEEVIVDMFTPHQPDGSIAPKDVRPKSKDPIEWILVPDSVKDDTLA